MNNTYKVIGTYRQPHKDSEGETLSNLTYDEAIKTVREWRKEKKYKDVFYMKED